MSDVIKRAQELVEKFDEKITGGKWDVDTDCNKGASWIQFGPELDYQKATEVDITAMSSVPEMLSVIKGLLREREILERQIFLYRHTPQKGNHRTDCEWRHTYWEAVNKIHPELNINTATSCDVAIAAICKIDNLTEVNQALKDRIAELGLLSALKKIIENPKESNNA